jgi:hypothetical protein
MRATWTCPLALALALSLPIGAGAQEVSVVDLTAGHEGAWRFIGGNWSMAEGVLEQEREGGPSAAILNEPGFADFTLTVEFNIRPVGSGVRAAALIFRATGTLTYYWLHLDSKNNQAILTRSTPGNTWIELGRKPLQLPADVWHTAQVACRGPRIVVTVDGTEVMSAEDDALTAGRVGVGTSQGRVAFRNLKIEGERQTMSEPLANEQPPFKVISRGEAAGTYQAFPDVCRLRNGDLAVVFYAGYGHVSVPNADWPKGGRICMVRSSDEGRTWSEPAIILDDADDNRDPHIAQMSDGTLICSFFSLRVVEGKYQLLGVQLARSTDGGRTWSPEAETIVPGWARSTACTCWGSTTRRTGWRSAA